MALGTKAASAQAVAAIETATSQVAYVGSVVVESSMWDLAHAVGTSRTLIKKMRGRKAHEDRGADDERIDTEGALAEIISAAVLEKSGADIAAFVAHKPDCGVDIRLPAGLKIDVKSVGQPRKFVNINCNQHFEKKADAYLIVHFASGEVADLFVVSASTVESWKQNTFLRGAPLDPRRYYWSGKLPIDSLEPLEVEETV